VPLTVAARDGSRERDEAEADAFGHRLAAVFRAFADGTVPDEPDTALDAVRRSMAYRGRGGGAR
jgi:hypothetical protein